MSAGTFRGRIASTAADSTPSWNPQPSTPGPNVVLVVLDDVGYGQFGCYGSSIATPRIDALAQQGLQYSNFHVTALCSPTRASLLTGRNHHSVGMGFLAQSDSGFPGYRGEVSHSAATIAEMLHDAGYGTYAAGKWHLTPPRGMSAAGPFDQWPTQRGFDRYYGFLWGEDDQFAPDLWYDQHRVDPPEDTDYHLSKDLVDRAKQFLADHVTSRPDDPFFLYLPFGACHAPHQAPAAYIDRNRGRFDDGWDVERERVLDRQISAGIVPPDTQLPPPNPGISHWNELGPDQRRLYTRLQEAYAAFLEYTDAQIGALVDFLTQNALLDNTVIIVTSDNGASAEGGTNGTSNEYRGFLGMPDTFDDTYADINLLGGPHAHNHYPSGWAQAGNTPLRFYKKFAFGGGIRSPLIIHWPDRINPLAHVRHQFHHVIDIFPTITDLAGISVPEMRHGVPQIPVHGISMQYSFDTDDTHNERRTQYFETVGNRAIIDKDWKAVAFHTPDSSFDEDQWELFNLRADYAETSDLALHDPERLSQMQKLWWEQAERYGVLPLDDRMGARHGSADPSADRRKYRMLPQTRYLNAFVGPRFSGRPFSVRAVFGAWQPGDEGVLLAWGRRAAGFTFYIKSDHLWFHLNLAGQHTSVKSPEPIPSDIRTLQLNIAKETTGASATFLADEVQLGSGQLPRLIPGGLGGMATSCAYNSPSPVCDDYVAPFEYHGHLEYVDIILEPLILGEAAADWNATLAHQ